MKRKGERDFKIVVMGCMVGPKDDDLRKRFPYVDHFARPQAFEGIFESLGLADDTGGEFWPTTFPTPTGPTAYVPSSTAATSSAPTASSPTAAAARPAGPSTRSARRSRTSCTAACAK